jgi:hypothetical protein
MSSAAPEHFSEDFQCKYFCVYCDKDFKEKKDIAAHLKDKTTDCYAINEYRKVNHPRTAELEAEDAAEEQAAEEQAAAEQAAQNKPVTTDEPGTGTANEPVTADDDDDYYEDDEDDDDYYEDEHEHEHEHEDDDGIEWGSSCRCMTCRRIALNN